MDLEAYSIVSKCFHDVGCIFQASRGKRFSSNDVIMVDPLEAKQLAAKQMQEIQAKQKLKRRRQIEAINGAWAIIGLTAGLIIEGRTGESMIQQLAGYWSAVIRFFIL